MAWLSSTLTTSTVSKASPPSLFLTVTPASQLTSGRHYLRTSALHSTFLPLITPRPMASQNAPTAPLNKSSVPMSTPAMMTGLPGCPLLSLPTTIPPTLPPPPPPSMLTMATTPPHRCPSLSPPPPMPPLPMLPTSRTSTILLSITPKPPNYSWNNKLTKTAAPSCSKLAILFISPLNTSTLPYSPPRNSEIVSLALSRSLRLSRPSPTASTCPPPCPVCIPSSMSPCYCPGAATTHRNFPAALFPPPPPLLLLKLIILTDGM